MLEWIGSLQIRERSPGRVVLCLSRSTRGAGLVVAAFGLVVALWLWDDMPIAAMMPATLVVLGAMLASLERRLVVDREAGVLQLEQRLLGVGSTVRVPLFHLRAVVVTARSDGDDRGRVGSRYVAYLDRRVGGTIYLDEARRCAGLMRLAEAIAEVAELRLEYEAAAAAD